MGKIFIAFAGKKSSETEITLRLSPTIEYWNLQNIDFDTFVDLVKKAIHPVHDNITDDRYAQDTWKCDVKQLYQNEASFGLLLPTPATDRNYGYHDAALHALNLFSPAFLYPIFHVDDLGCSATPHLHTSREYGQTVRDQPDVSKHFRTENFVKYYEKTFGSLDYFGRNRDLGKTWMPNDWRLCWMHTLYGDLRGYQNTAKIQGTFLKECVDLCVILEALFFDEKAEKETPMLRALLHCLFGKRQGIGSKLKQRTAVLVGSFRSGIPNTIYDLYDLRCKYVHGEIFRKMKGFDDGSPTGKDFDFLEKATSYVRYLLIAYTFLYVQRQDIGVKNDEIVPLLDAAILDCTLRKKIQEKSQEILSLLPTN
ncbi:hypothetical protein HYW84_00215 [Candidatus Peregrinibacteria bacterium]|nr:hypothetical protein [Candidatus Peregrinibacteria bacterium]